MGLKADYANIWVGLINSKPVTPRVIWLRFFCRRILDVHHLGCSFSRFSFPISFPSQFVETEGEAKKSRMSEHKLRRPFHSLHCPQGSVRLPVCESPISSFLEINFWSPARSRQESEQPPSCRVQEGPFTQFWIIFPILCPHSSHSLRCLGSPF